MTTDRAFAIGSISKFFTALVVDAIVQEGMLHFDDPSRVASHMGRLAP